MIKRAFYSLAIASLLLFGSAFAQEAKSLVATVVAPSDGGPVDSYELFMNGASLGEVQPGENSFPGVIEPTGGTYTFQVFATNQFDTTPGQEVVITLLAPGVTKLIIQIE